jgi:hypothetical protein
MLSRFQSTLKHLFLLWLKGAFSAAPSIPVTKLRGPQMADNRRNFLHAFMTVEESPLGQYLAFKRSQGKIGGLGRARQKTEVTSGTSPQPHSSASRLPAAARTEESVWERDTVIGRLGLIVSIFIYSPRSTETEIEVFNMHNTR